MLCFGVCTFFGKSHNGDRFGANGLPLTPSSVRILGKFQRLKDLQHRHLTSYLDFYRGKSERIFVISEHYKTSLVDILSVENGSQEIQRVTPQQILGIGEQILEALNYLHQQSIVVGCLSLENVLVVEQNLEIILIKLTQYGIYYITKSGQDVDFSICSPWYMAPEVLARKWRDRRGPKSDIWALGIILLECYCGITLKSLWKARQMYGVMTSVIQRETGDSAAGGFLDAIRMAKPDISVHLNDQLWHIISSCLTIDPSKRPTANEVLDVFSVKVEIRTSCPQIFNPKDVFRCCNRSVKLTSLKNVQNLIKDITSDMSWYDYPLSTRPIEEVYFLWKLAGSSVERILNRKGLIKTKAPVSSLPSLAVDECEIFGNEMGRQSAIDLIIVPLELTNLNERLISLPVESFFISLELTYGSNVMRSDEKHKKEDDIDRCPDLPTVVKERSIEYQLKRMVLFERLVNAYPCKKEILWKEASTDIAPLYRGYVWAALLNVRGDVTLDYDKVDKLTVTPTDRQIEVDIPRCHQYDELLSSPRAHEKFKRILKAWIVTHPQFVYWQGLDSLCAPFLYLHFENEALAYSCLKAFIPRYLHNFFLKDNAAIIQEYLAVFNHVISFHDPELYMHLSDIGFVPELYAIPWFLTMFAHVLPLHKLFHLWDTLLLGSSAFPLCVGVAILLQLRDRLMHFGFNECILLFSDLPEVDIERCVTDSVYLYRRTPRSAGYRSHAPITAVDGEADCLPRAGSLTEYPTINQQTLIQLKMSAISLEELKDSHCGRMCAEELLSYISSRDTVVGNNDVNVLVVDVRPGDEYNRGAFPGSINIPLSSFDLDETQGLQLPPGAASEQLFRQRGKSVIVIIGSHQTQMKELAERLVKLGYPRVCTLHNGIDVFRHTTILTGIY